MRKTAILLLIAVAALSAASIKDPRQNVKISPELSQAQVERQQALQRMQGQVGVVPDRTDQSGYIPQTQEDANAGTILAQHDPANESTSEQALKANGEEIVREKERPKAMAFSAFWALFAGMVLAVGTWAGLQKFGPKPPEHLR